jgi:hypothetical protein
MARVVVVASSEVSREALGKVVAPEDELFVLVPAVEQSRLEWLANDEDAARERAARVGQEIESAASSEATSTEVKADHPGQLVLDAVARHTPDRVVLALRRGEEATWLEEGELDAIPESVNGVPVVHLEI